jgi:hypothetical protein
MAPRWRFISLALIFILPLGVTFMSRDVESAPVTTPEVICQIDSLVTTIRDHHTSNIVVPIYLTNLSDSIFGFTIWVRSTWPELLRFVLVVDTTVDTLDYGPPVIADTNIIDVAKFDTVGTRCGGFEFFDSRIQDPSLRSQAKISGICEKNRQPPIVKPMPPNGGVLLNLIMETTAADSVCANIPQMKILLQFDRTQTSFSNPASQTIGCNYALEVDTTHPGGCYQYAPPPHADSCVAWWDTVIVTRMRCVSIDTIKRMLIDGSNEFVCGPPCTCGDANSDNAFDIADAVFLISYIFRGGATPLDCGYAAGMGDANGDRSVDIADAVFLISYIFKGGATPHCQ